MRVTNSTCRLPGNSKVTKETIPTDENAEGEEEFSACQMYNYYNTSQGFNFTTEKIDCNNGYVVWEKDFERSIQTEV